MSDGVDFTLEGIDSLISKLEAVNKDVKRKGGRAALRRAAAVVVAAAVQGAQGINDPETGRHIAENIAMRWNGRLFKRTGDLGFRIGVLHGAKLEPGADTGAGGPTPHWRLHEFGTEKMPATPFMRKALTENIEAATATFLTQYERYLDRAISRGQGNAGG